MFFAKRFDIKKCSTKGLLPNKLKTARLNCGPLPTGQDCRNENEYYLRKNNYPVGIYMLKVKNRNTRTRCEICSKLTIKTPEQRLASF